LDSHIFKNDIPNTGISFLINYSLSFLAAFLSKTTTKFGCIFKIDEGTFVVTGPSNAF